LRPWASAVKAWLATLAVVLALFQLVSAFAMYRLIPGATAPAWMGTAHVWALWFFQTNGITF
jgi:hypothetical protein